MKKFQIIILFILFSSISKAQWERVPLDIGVSTSMIEYNNKIFIGGKYIGFYISEDNGKSWFLSKNGISSNSFETYSFVILDNLYACTNSGVYQFDENNMNWDLKYNYSSSTLYKKDSLVIIALNPIGLVRSFNNGETWEYEKKVNFLNCQSIISYDGNILATSTTGLFKFIDSKDEWEKINSGSFLKLYIESDILFAAGVQDLFKTFNEGVTWDSIFVPYETVVDFVLIDNKRIVCTYEGGIFCKTDIMPRWRPAQWGFDKNSYQFTKDLFISGSYIYASNNNGLWKRNISDFDLPELSVNGQKNNECKIGEKFISQIVIGNDGYDTAFVSNIVSSNDKFKVGQTRITIPPDWGWSVLIEYSPEEVGEETTTLTVYSNTKLGKNKVQINVQVLPAEYYLLQNYPNPFNPITKINYSISKTEYVSLNLYNSVGQFVRKLVSDIQIGGKHEVTISSNGLSSGVYYYQLKAGKFQEVKKLILLK